MKNKPYSIALAAALLSAGTAAIASEVHWSYEGLTGPDYWATLSPEFHLCGDGTEQSPIDISGASGGDLDSIEFDYGSTPLAVKNNGHTIQVDYKSGSSITIGETEYQLLQFHFHTPSENTVSGAPYAMEAHLVHINDLGQLAVVGVFMKQGEHNDFIQKIWDVMPAVEGAVTVKGAKLNANNLLPDDPAFFRFAGSLTTPPCSEGVRWNVMQNPVEVSADQIAQFQAIFSANARPVQALNDRTIEASSGQDDGDGDTGGGKGGKK